jgi:hypothetical protein
MMEIERLKCIKFYTEQDKRRHEESKVGHEKIVK